jgi:hypothetical protein
MKFENIAKVGDFIRAYDFKPCRGRADAYIEGVVEQVNNTEMGFKAFKVTVTADKFIGDVETVKSPDNRIGKIMFVPYEVSFMEYDSRILNLSE